MQQSEMIWLSADNSKIYTAKQINVYKSRQPFPMLASQIIIYPRKYKMTRRIKKRAYCGLVLSVKKRLKRPNGHSFKSNLNRLVVYSREGKHRLRFLGSRVYGGCCRELRTIRGRALFQKIISYSKHSY